MTTSLYYANTPGKPRLRVGVMLDDWNVPAWVGELLTDVQSSGVADLTTVILNRDKLLPKTRVKRGLLGRLKPIRTLLWRVYERIDQRLRPFFASPFEPTDVRTLFGSANRIEVIPKRHGKANRFEPDDIAVINGERLDVILRFGFNIIHGEILSAATYGVWSFHHGDNNEYRGSPAGFWEMYDRNPLTGTILQVLNEKLDAGQVIYRTYGSTASFESLVVSRYWLYRKAIPFVTRCLRRIYEQGAAGLSIETSTAAPPPIRRTPSNAQMIHFLFRAVWRISGIRLRRLLGQESGHWFLGIARGADPASDLAGKVVPIYPPSGRFWADPILARRNGQSFLFFEDYDYSTELGRISAAELDQQDRVVKVRTVLEKDHHLSYPFVFEWQGEHFMIPETSSVRAVQLYRATEFPWRWEHMQDLLTDVEAVDATVCEHDGKWFLFTAISEAGGSTCDELFLFVADQPIGPWTAHPMNPIVSDVRCARPGGPLFRRDGVIYRPGQNSARFYGQALAVAEVTELTPLRYAEQLAYRIEPNWLPGIRGCHTITMDGDLTVLDCRTIKWRP